MEEWLDVLDCSGHPTGACELRGEVHRAGLWHRTVHVWVRNRLGQMLLQKRSQTKDVHPGLWDVSAAGHIDAGEQPANAAMRELREELGLRVEESGLAFLFTVTDSYSSPEGKTSDNEFHDVFLLRRPVEPADLRACGHEIDELRFFDVEVLKSAIERGDPLFAPHPQEYRRLFAASWMLQTEALSP